MYSGSPKDEVGGGDLKAVDSKVDPLELLFFDTFSHENNEEINLDLVQFPKPVFIGEIRIIPLGARVQADFPGGVRLGATNPSQFKIEFFVNDLSKPGASTFQNLGIIDYNQNGNINFECERDQLISTDGLVLRGWYTTITLAVYGNLTKTTSPEPARPDMSTVEWLQQHQQMEVVDSRGNYAPDLVPTHYGSYPVQEGGMVEPEVYNRPIPRQPPYPWPQGPNMHSEQYDRPKEMYDGENWDVRRDDNQHWDSRKERHQDQFRYDRRRPEDQSPEYDEHVSADYGSGGRSSGGQDYYGSKRARNWAGNDWPGSNQAGDGVVAVPLAAASVKRPHTPPIPTPHQECSPGQNTQFESMSPGDVESISEGDIPETEGLDDNVKSPLTPPGKDCEAPQGANSPRQPFEPILSDDEIIDDQFQDMDYDFSEYAEDPLKSFNPYNNEIPTLKMFADPSFCPCEWECGKVCEDSLSEGQALIDVVALAPNPMDDKEGWVEAAGQVSSILVKSLPKVAKSKRKDLMSKLIEWVSFGLDFEEAFTQPRPAMKLRHIKVGIKLVETISDCGEDYAKQMIETANAQAGLLSLFHKEYMALVIKLMILRALDATLRYKSCIELFIERRGTNGYEQLLDIVQSTHHARIKFSLSSLLHKVNFYDLLLKLRSSCEKIEKELQLYTNDDGEIDDKFKFDEEFLTCALEEILRTYINATMLLSQPKRFLPVSSQFEINTTDFPDPYPAVFTYFRFAGLLKSCIVLLNLPSHSIIMPVNNLLAELLETDGGMKFLASSREINEIICLMLGSSTKHYKNVLRVNPTLGLHLAYRLRALLYLDEILSLHPDCTDPDESRVLDVLQGLYNLTLSNIGNIGKSAVVHVVSQGNNVEIFTKLLKRKASKKRSPSRGYVCDLLVLCIKLSTTVTFLQKYCGELIELVTTDFTEIQDVQQWLKPYKNMAGEVSNACEILKNSQETCVTLPPEMICAVRLLRHLSIPKGDKDLCVLQDDSEYVELKYKFSILQLYALDGLSNITTILQKLCKFYEQPYLYSSRLIGRQGLLLTAFILPAVQLIRRMLTHVIRARNTDFKDLTVVPVLLQTYALMQAVPLNGQANTDSLRVCREIIETLLAYTQPISSEDSSENEALNKSLWTQMMGEVLKFSSEVPLNFVTGLMILSELLPLPLPLQCHLPLTESESNKLMNSRRLWSAHLLSLNPLLESMIALMSTSSCHPLLQILRRVCVQLADLAAPSALMVVRTLTDSILPLLDVSRTDSTLPRLLNFLARLMTHGSVKSAFLFLVATNDKYKGIINSMTDIFKTLSDKPEWQQSQECLASILLSITDTEISLVPPSTLSSEIYLSHALPSKETLQTICNSLLDHLLLNQPFNTCLTAMRTFILLVEHDFGFYHVKLTYEKRPSAIHDLFARINKAWSKENHDLLATLSATLDFLRALACLEGVEYSLRKQSYSLPELLHLIKWATNHPLHSIEDNLKGIVEEDETLEPLLENVSSFIKILEEDDLKPIEPKEIPEPVLPTPQPLLSQFALRTVFVLGPDVHEERLTASYWLAPPNPDEHESESEQVPVDLMELAKTDLNGLNLSEAMTRLLNRKSGKTNDNAPEGKKVKPNDEATKKAYQAPTRGRNLRAACGVGRGDTFRSRPPNTSRPPSLHVDDFVALETCGGPAGMGRPTGMVNTEKIGRARGRGRSFGMERGGRYFGAHPTYHREPAETVWDRGMYGGTDMMGNVDPNTGANGRFSRAAPPMGAWAQDNRGPHPTERGHLHPNFFQR
uniref:Protein virilizer n=3 Tax=Lygus hesperus TaxID=30085 RepID=A0A146LN92_LYGHE